MQLNGSASYTIEFVSVLICQLYCLHVVVIIFDVTCRGRGLVSWFPVHCTSMNNTNAYLSGDNKGAAELFTEKWASSQSNLEDDFIAAFAQSNVGDTSPNVLGPVCLDTGNAAICYGCGRGFIHY